MKIKLVRFISFWTFFAALLGSLFAQNGLVVSRSSSAITLDDATATATLFHEWYGRAQSAFSSTAPNPADAVRITDHLIISGRIDSLKASVALDSFSVKIQSLDLNGYLIGDVFWLDFGNNNTNASEVENAWVPFNRSAAVVGTTSATFWCDLAGLMIASHGVKLTIEYEGETVNDSLRVTFDVAQGLSGLRN